MRLSLASAFALGALLTLSACVSKGTYQKKVNEVSHLQQTVAGVQSDNSKLQQANADLETHNDKLNRQLTTALDRNADLQQDLLRARADTTRVENVLTSRSAKAGKAMTEMRQEIDRLQGDNCDLQQQVQRERIAREARIAKITSTYNELVNKMQQEVKRGEVTISELQGKLTVNMVDRILFAPGKAQIKPAGLKVLRRVGEILKKVKDKDIRVEGHTDNVPISPRLKSTYHSNWELSTARATNVVHFLQDQVGLPGERLSACGFSSYRPVASNDTPQGRAQNRRIQIELVPLQAQIVKPLK